MLFLYSFSIYFIVVAYLFGGALVLYIYGAASNKLIVSCQVLIIIYNKNSNK